MLQKFFRMNMMNIVDSYGLAKSFMLKYFGISSQAMFLLCRKNPAVAQLRWFCYSEVHWLEEELRQTRARRRKNRWSREWRWWWGVMVGQWTVFFEILKKVGMYFIHQRWDSGILVFCQSISKMWNVWNNLRKPLGESSLNTSLFGREFHPWNPTPPVNLRVDLFNP